jgi:hypothetical protein
MPSPAITAIRCVVITKPPEPTILPAGVVRPADGGRSDTLGFIRNKAHWGAPLRFGFVALPAADFARIAAAMDRGRSPARAANG